MTRHCPRKCPGCCNDQYAFDGDVEEIGVQDIQTRLAPYHTIVWTGGEPLLVADKLIGLLMTNSVTRNNVLYTSYSTPLPEQNLRILLAMMTGVTFSVHFENWTRNVHELQYIQHILKASPKDLDSRLSIDSRVPFAFSEYIEPDCWSSVKIFDWLPPEECSPPTNEDLFYLPLD